MMDLEWLATDISAKKCANLHVDRKSFAYDQDTADADAFSDVLDAEPPL